MSKLRRKFIVALAVLFCALLTISAALIIPKNKTAEAYTGPQAATVSEIYSDDDNRFNYKALQSLYNAILSGTDKTLDEVAAAANTDTVLSNKGIQVQFGGLVWTAVYLSKATDSFAGTGAPAKGKATNGDVVLTLWLAYPDINKPAQWNEWYSGSVGTYPSNLYGTSYMRSVVLNNGGEYWPSSSSTINYTPTANNEWGFSKFTNPTYIENGQSKSSTIMNHIVSPRYISWQYSQNSSSTETAGHSYNCNNDPWGTVNGTSFESYDKYGAWKDDLLWLPSMAETGSSVGGGQGLWKISEDQRRTQSDSIYAWLRSVSGNVNAAWCWKGSVLQDVYVTSASSSGSVTTLVRPALHLNLTTADKDSRRIFFDDDTAGAEEHEYELTYNGVAQEIDILDYYKLDKVSDPTAGSSYAATTGKFSATLPQTSDSKTYTLRVKPKEGFYWDDITDSTKTTKERDYKIKIKLADVSTENWSSSSTCTYGESLLQDEGDLVLQGSVTPTVVYHLEHDDSDFPPDSPEPTEFNDNGDLTAESGYYRVWYKITADYHNEKVGSYTVQVGSDSVTVSVNGTFSSVTYGEKTAEEIQSSLKERFTGLVNANNVTMTGSSGAYGTDQILALLNNLNVVPCTKSSNRLVAAPATNGYYAAGTYYLDLKYASGSGDNQFVWQSDVTFTIKKRDVHVNIVAENGGDLTHEYGNEPVSMTYELDSAYTNEVLEVDRATMATALRLSYIFTIADTDEELENNTPVNEYDIVSSAGEGNYNVIFGACKYKITKRNLTLKVIDEEVGYGTDLTNHTFKGFTLVSGTFVGSDGVGVITSKTYSITANNASFNLNDILLIGEYVLSATAEADNYIFDITAGKLTVTKGNFDMSGVTLTNAGYIYDGQPHAAQISGTLPSEEITVSYRYVNYNTGEELDGPPTEVGLYIVYASFSHDNLNYNPITTVKAAYIRIAYTQEELNEPYPPLPTDEDIAANADLAQKKGAAKSELDKAAQAKKDAIDADINLSAEEKAATKADIDKQLEEGKKSIDKATNASGVNKALDDGKKEIYDTADLAQKKGAAKSELDKAAQAKKDAIDADPSLTDEEKAAAKAEVDKELEEGKKATDSATNVDGVQSAESSTKTNIENVKVEHTVTLDEKKSSAKSELEKAASKKKAEIDDNDELTEEEKDEAKAKVDSELQKGLNAIESAEDDDELSQTVSERKTKIENINPEHKSSFPWWILAVIAGALVLATVLIIVIVKRRNSDDDDGYDDFYDDEYDYDEEEEIDDGDEEAYGF